MSKVVKITRDDNGEKVMYPKWHHVRVICGGNATFCGSEYFGEGESGCEYVEKEGKITCPLCISEIKLIKSIKI